jgi:NAD(P)-dependent dehydrogenase (short-subunit alcohol dehydrogenase family)
MMVTGAASGLGFETARVLARAGASVVAAVLPSQADEALRRLRAQVPAGDFSVLVLDLSDLAFVRRAAEEYNSSGRPLHVLVNNAGVMACPLTASTDGYELQFAVNFLVSPCVCVCVRRT